MAQANNALVAATAAMAPAALRAVQAAWPFAALVQAGTVSTRAGLYAAMRASLAGATWAQAVPAGMLLVGQHMAAHIKANNGNVLRYAKAQYLQRACGNGVGVACTPTQLLGLTPANIAAALAKYANFTASTANYNGIATAIAQATHTSSVPIYIGQMPASGIAVQASGTVPAVTTGWANAAAPQPKG